MTKNFGKIVLCLMIIFFRFHLFNLLAIQNDYDFIENDDQKNRSSAESLLLDSIEDLYVSENHLFIHLNGTLYSIQSLQQVENQWLVTFNGYCPRMHLLCECGHCHNQHCYYYVKYCSRGK